MFADGDTDLTLTINEKYAQKYEHKKRFEELTQLRERYGDEFEDEPDSESEEEEDEVGELITPEIDAQILKTIRLIRSGKPEVYDPKRHFFSEEEMQAARKEWKKKKQHIKQDGKPMRLKDFHRQQLLEGVTNEHEAPSPVKHITHVEEQDLIKSSFKSAVQDDEDNEDFLTLRPKSEDQKAREEEEYRQFLLEKMADEGGQGLKDYRVHTQAKASDPDEAFLLDYILNRGWLDKAAHKIPSYDEIVDDIDEEAVDAAEDFEREHNFRFEEEGSNQLITHARIIDGTLRRKDDKRKLLRQAKNARKAEERLRKEEELKRLKNLRKEEIKKRLQQIREVAGGDIVGLGEVDLTEDFDPGQFDKKMAEAFNEDYYNQDEHDALSDLGDDIGIDDIIPAPIDSSGNRMDRGFWPKKGDGDYLPGRDNAPRFESAQEVTGAGATENTKPSGSHKLSLDQYFDAYYQLDYEDMIGDTPTRFKYRTVEPEDFGLKPMEILEAEDADLNELIGLKKLAPFRRHDLVEKDKTKWSKSRKKRLREFRKKLESKKRATAQGAEDLYNGYGGDAFEGSEGATRGVSESGRILLKRKKQKKDKWSIDKEPERSLTQDRMASYQVTRKH